MGSETFLAYSKQDRVVARRPHVLSCGGYCVVPCIAIVVSQLQFDSLLSLGRETGRFGRLQFFGSESCAMEVYAFRSIGFVLVVTASEPARPGRKRFSGCFGHAATLQAGGKGERGERQTPTIALNDVSCCFASKNCQ